MRRDAGYREAASGAFGLDNPRQYARSLDDHYYRDASV